MKMVVTGQSDSPVVVVSTKSDAGLSSFLGGRNHSTHTVLVVLVLVSHGYGYNTDHNL